MVSRRRLCVSSGHSGSSFVRGGAVTELGIGGPRSLFLKALLAFVGCLPDCFCCCLGGVASCIPLVLGLVIQASPALMTEVGSVCIGVRGFVDLVLELGNVGIECDAMLLSSWAF